MGSYSNSDSDYEYERKKKKKSRRTSRSPTGSTNSRKSKHKRRRSRSQSRKHSKRAHRSQSRDRYRSRSRDRNRTRSRDRHRSCSRGRRRSRDNSYDHRRSRSRSRGHLERRRGRSKSSSGDRNTKADSEIHEIKGFADMTPSEQNKARMQLAIEKAKSADEAIRQRHGVDEKVVDTKKRQAVINKIEKDSFHQQSFTSHKSQKLSSKKSFLEQEFSFGTALDFTAKTREVFSDLAHPRLAEDPEVRKSRWHEKLKQLRHDLVLSER